MNLNLNINQLCLPFGYRTLLQSQGQYKNWCFTAYPPQKFPTNLTDNECIHVKANYLVYQPEECPETQRKHIQGYIQLEKKVRLTAIKKLWPQAHFEPMRGSNDQAIAYCKKEESFCPFDGFVRYEFGVCSKQGGRSDVTELKELVVQKGGLKRIAEEHPEAFLRYSRLEKWGDLLRPERENKPRQVIVYYGAPGTGKSRIAYRDFGDDMYTPAQNNSAALSFETYDQQSCILIDDFVPGNLGAGALKTMTDRYPNKLPGRNVSPANMADTVIITSNIDPKEWFVKDPTFYPALVRRCASMIECELSGTGLVVWKEIVSDGKLLAFPRVIDTPEFDE